VAESLTEEEQVAAIKRWWEENGTSLIVSLVIVISGVFGYNWYQNNERVQAESAAQLYADYLETRENNDTSEAILNELAAAHTGSGYHVFTLLMQAADAVKIGELEAAQIHLEEAFDAAEDPFLRSLVSIRLARNEQQLGESDRALGRLNNVKGDGMISLAAELKGDILFSKGESEAARVAYELALEKAGAERPVLKMKLADLAVGPAIEAEQADSEPAEDKAQTPSEGELVPESGDSEKQ